METFKLEKQMSLQEYRYPDNNLSSSIEFEAKDPKLKNPKKKIQPIEIKVADQQNNEKYRIAMVSDFFVPNLGGVEMHMYNVSQCLMERGHKVIVITSSYADERVGIRYLSNGLKVYYIPVHNMYSQTSHPPILHVHNNILRQIFIRERIQIVHGHQATAVLMIHATKAAQSQGLRTMMTDHSLFGFNDLSSISINKVMKWILANADAAICVSHVNKDNLTLRGALNPGQIFVIPNSVDVNKFTPNPGLRYPLNTINIVTVSRLTFRKGIDLLVDVIPEILRKYPNVHFIIGGDGPKMNILKEMRDKYNIADKVELLGSLPHDKVASVLCRGHIFLNPSLTEAFCIAILEAASCGLLCVSTNVGGIPEVLPPGMVYLAQARPKPLIEQLENAIKNVKNIPCTKMHETVKSLYSWHNVSERTEKVYHYVMQRPQSSVLTRVKNSLSMGTISGIGQVALYILTLTLLWIYEAILPKDKIDIAEDFDCDTYRSNPERFGNHIYNVNQSQESGQKKPSEGSRTTKRTNLPPQPQ